jgi:carbon storage regulator CsrA
MPTMLVLSRRANESIVFPELQITVQVLEIKGDRVRLGFEAPGSVTILRGELTQPAPSAGDRKSARPTTTARVHQTAPQTKPAPESPRGPNRRVDINTLLKRVQ